MVSHTLKQQQTSVFCETMHHKQSKINLSTTCRYKGIFDNFSSKIDHFIRYILAFISHILAIQFTNLVRFLSGTTHFTVLRRQHSFNPHPVVKKYSHMWKCGVWTPIKIPVKRHFNAWQGTLMC